MSVASHTKMEHGWCRTVPSRLADLLWGLEAPPGGDKKAAYELRRAGVRICEMCPIQHHCLAQSMVDEAQEGIHGGLSLKARRQLKQRAVAFGIGFDARSNDVDVTQVRRWLDAHPGEIEQARDRENAQRRQRYARYVVASRRPAKQSTPVNLSRPAGVHLGERRSAPQSRQALGK